MACNFGGICPSYIKRKGAKKKLPVSVQEVPKKKTENKTELSCDETASETSGKSGQREDKRTNSLSLTNSSKALYGPETNSQHLDVTYKLLLGPWLMKKPKVFALELSDLPKWILFCNDNKGVPISPRNLFSAFPLNFGSTDQLTYLQAVFEALKSPKTVVICLNPRCFFKWSIRKKTHGQLLEAELMSLISFFDAISRPPLIDVYIIGFATDPEDHYFEGRLGKFNRMVEVALGDRFINPRRFIPKDLSTDRLERPSKEKADLLEEELHFYLMKEIVDYLIEKGQDDMIVKENTDQESDEEQEIKTEEENINVQFVKTDEKEKISHGILLKNSDQVEMSVKETEIDVEKSESDEKLEEKSPKVIPQKETRMEMNILDGNIDENDDLTEQELVSMPLDKFISNSFVEKNYGDQKVNDEVEPEVLTDKEPQKKKKQSEKEKKKEKNYQNLRVAYLSGLLEIIELDDSREDLLLEMEAVRIWSDLQKDLSNTSNYKIGKNLKTFPVNSAFHSFLFDGIMDMFGFLGGLGSILAQNQNSSWHYEALGKAVKEVILGWGSNLTLEQIGGLFKGSVGRTADSKTAIIVEFGMSDAASGVVLLAYWSVILMRNNVRNKSIEEYFLYLEESDKKACHLKRRGRPDVPNLPDEEYDREARILAEDIERICTIKPYGELSIDFFTNLEKDLRSDIVVEASLFMFKMFEPYFEQNIRKTSNKKLRNEMLRKITLKICREFSVEIIGQLFRQGLVYALKGKYLVVADFVNEIAGKALGPVGVVALRVWSAMFEVPEEGDGNKNTTETGVDDAKVSVPPKDTEYTCLMEHVISIAKARSAEERNENAKKTLFSVVTRIHGFRKNFESKILNYAREKDEDFRRLKETILTLFINLVSKCPHKDNTDELILGSLQTDLSFAVNFRGIDGMGKYFSNFIIKMYPPLIRDPIVREMQKESNETIAAIFFELVNQLLMPEKDDPELIDFKGKESLILKLMNKVQENPAVKRVRGFELTPEIQSRIKIGFLLMDNVVLVRRFKNQFEKNDSIFSQFDRDLIYNVMEGFSCYLDHHRDDLYSDRETLGVVLKTGFTIMLQYPDLAVQSLVALFNGRISDPSSCICMDSLMDSALAGLKSYLFIFVCALADENISKMCKKL